MAFSDSAWAVNEILEQTGDLSSPAGTDTIFGLLKRGMVKSVQRGVVSFSQNANKTVNISAVNPSKTIVILKSDVEAGASVSDTERFAKVNKCSILQSLSSGNFIVTPPFLLTPASFGVDYNYGKVSWQVIEFY